MTETHIAVAASIFAAAFLSGVFWTISRIANHLRTQDSDREKTK